MSWRVEPFCLGLLKTLFSASNKPNLTYVAATSDCFWQICDICESYQNRGREAFWRPQEAKMGIGGESGAAMQQSK